MRRVAFVACGLTVAVLAAVAYAFLEPAERLW
jgi:hypothetical protein